VHGGFTLSTVTYISCPIAVTIPAAPSAKTIAHYIASAYRNCCKSKDTKVLHLLSIGKTPLDVAIELDLPPSKVYEIQLEYWSLKELHDLVFVYNEIKYYLPSFIKLFHTLKHNKLLSEERISKFLRYADHDLPVLENKIQNLTGDVIELEWKKKDLNNTITL
jgi:hypothetical protein